MPEKGFTKNKREGGKVEPPPDRPDIRCVTDIPDTKHVSDRPDLLHISDRPDIIHVSDRPDVLESERLGDLKKEPRKLKDYKMIGSNPTMFFPTR